MTVYMHVITTYTDQWPIQSTRPAGNIARKLPCRNEPGAWRLYLHIKLLFRPTVMVPAYRRLCNQDGCPTPKRGLWFTSDFSHRRSFLQNWCLPTWMEIILWKQDENIWPDTVSVRTDCGTFGGPRIMTIPTYCVNADLWAPTWFLCC